MKNMPFAGLSALFARIEATGRKKSDTMTYASASNRAVRVLGRLKKGNNKVMVIGNGGSAGIASHVVTDFLKNVGIAALAFNDAAQITCLSNDLGYEAVF
ncbi:MAG: phosphoheptose isomerase, partial [Candidatus Omnitrophica bacterium]|nr:phosphoheptose isomerase [Candidatus Omnitrophota bacterium]